MTEQNDPRPRVAVDPAIDPRDADRAKAWYADSSFQPRDHDMGVPAATALVLRLIASAAPRRVLEFGCNAGRNLAELRQCLPDATLAGVDVNAASITWGRRRWPDLDLTSGDESALSRFADGSFDVAFTVSALDHVPLLDRVGAELTRVTDALLVLAEIWGPRTGKVTAMTDARGRRVAAAPFCYIHDYRRTFESGLGWTNVADFACPAGCGDLLETYRVFVFARHPGGLIGDVRLRPLPPGS